MDPSEIASLDQWTCHLNTLYFLHYHAMTETDQVSAEVCISNIPQTMDKIYQTLSENFTE
jgi:hypothetical protein